MRMEPNDRARPVEISDEEHGIQAFTSLVESRAMVGAPTIEGTTTNTNHRASGRLLGSATRLDKRARKFVPALIDAEWVSVDMRPWRLLWLSISGVAERTDGGPGKTRRSVEWTTDDLHDAPWWARRWCAQHAPPGVRGQQTSGGVVLTEDVIERVAKQAEQGYDRSQLRQRFPGAGFAGEQCPTCDGTITEDGWCNCFCRGCGRPRLHNDCDFGKDTGV